MRRTMFDKGFQRCFRHGIDRFPANQAVHIQCGRISRIFHSCRSPQQLGTVCPLLQQSGKIAAIKKPLPIQISGFGQSNRRFTAQMLGQHGIQGTVDTRNKKAGHHMDIRHCAACSQTCTDAAHISFIGFQGLLARKQQGQIDADAVCHQTFQRFQTLIGCRHFDHRVFSADCPMKPPGFGHRAFGIVRQLR